MNSRLNITLATTPLSPQSVLTRLQHQWLVISTATFIGVVLAAVAAFTVKPRFEVDAFLDKPYASELTELNIGRSSATGLEPYSPDQVYTYFVRRLVTDEAKQRFFRETYLPSLESPPQSEEEKQALYNRMLKLVLNVTPLPRKPGMEEISIAWMLTHAAASSPLNGSKLFGAGIRRCKKRPNQGYRTINKSSYK
jgi:chain length determinant protein (polysaccharide antigen chain regulator)